MKGLLLAGGRGTRMQPLTHTNNKHAIPIANKPLLAYPFEMMVNAGIKEIGIIVNETREEIEEILGDGSKWGVKVEYIFQDYPGGLAHALSFAEEFMDGEKFVMVLGDNILENGMKEYVEYFEKTDAKGHILGMKVPVVEHKRYGMATLDKNGFVLRYIEKPGVVDMSPLYNSKTSYAVPGFYFLDSEVFKCFHGKGKIKPSSRGELEIADAYNWLVENNHKVTLDVVKGWYKDPGSPEDTLITNQVILDTLIEDDNKGSFDKKASYSGKLNIAKGVKIINSVIRGPVIIGGKCVIENSFIGPYSSISTGCVIKDAEIENSILMENVHVQDMETRLDSCMIGSDSEITENGHRPKATKLVIGDNSVVRL